MSVVISDTSPIRCLAFLERLDLLHQLFGEVIVPPAVAAELRAPKYGPPADHALQLPYVRVREPQSRELVNRLLETLDAGEAEALALALELEANAVLIDEAAGRVVAKQLGLTTVGVLGMLVRAKDRGLVESITPLVDKLQYELDFFISAKLRADTLRQAGEDA